MSLKRSKNIFFNNSKSSFAFPCNIILNFKSLAIVFLVFFLTNFAAWGFVPKDTTHYLILTQLFDYFFGFLGAILIFFYKKNLPAFVGNIKKAYKYILKYASIIFFVELLFGFLLLKNNFHKYETSYIVSKVFFNFYKTVTIVSILPFILYGFSQNEYKNVLTITCIIMVLTCLLNDFIKPKYSQEFEWYGFGFGLNPNKTCLGLILALIPLSAFKNFQLKSIVLVPLLLISLSIFLFSGSRSSLLYFACLLLMVLKTYYDSMSLKKFLMFLVILYLCGYIAISLAHKGISKKYPENSKHVFICNLVKCFYTLRAPKINDDMTKFCMKYYSKDNRSYISKAYFKEIKFWGNFNDFAFYFDTSYYYPGRVSDKWPRKYLATCHNSPVGLLFTYGVFSIVFFGVIIYILKKMFVYEKQTALIFLIFFILAGTLDGGFYFNKWLWFGPFICLFFHLKNEGDFAEKD